MILLIKEINMSTELATIQHQTLELANARQEIEIMKLKFELQKLQAQKVSRLDDSLFSPSLFPHYQKVAETLSRSGVIPNAYKGKPEDIFVAISMGYQLGFPVEQSLQDIAVINGRPCLWGDGLLALVLNHPDCIGINEVPIHNGKVISGYVCTVMRKGHEPHSKSFTLQDAERAGLLKKGGPWSAYPERMLQMRARSYAIRDKFADALRGLKVAEEVQELDDKSNIIDVQQIKKEEKQVDKLKTILKEVENLNISQEKCDFIEDKENEDRIEEIKRLMMEKNFDESRINKALEYFKVEYVEDMTTDQLKSFKSHLERIPTTTIEKS